MGRVEGKTLALAPFPSEWERGQEDELFEFNSGTSDCGAGKGIDIINGDETIKTTWSSDIYESISTSFLKSNVNSFFYIGISKRDNRQDKVSAGPPLANLYAVIIAHAVEVVIVYLAVRSALL